MVDGSEVTAHCKLCLNAQSNHIGRMKKLYEKFNCMVDSSEVTAQCKLCLNAQSNHIGRMKKLF